MAYGSASRSRAGQRRWRDPGDGPDAERRPPVALPGRPAVPPDRPDRGSRACTPSLVAGACTRASRALTAPEYIAPQRTDAPVTRHAPLAHAHPVRQSRAMTTRRGARPTHVRPRPPSSGRPAPPRSGPGRRSPAGSRPTARSTAAAACRSSSRSRMTPRGRRASAPGSCTSAPAASRRSPAASAPRSPASSRTSPRPRRPTPTVPIVSDAPSLAPPDEPYTNSPQVDLVVTVPAAMVGDTDHRIRVYLALEDQAPAAIQEVPIAADRRRPSSRSS